MQPQGSGSPILGITAHGIADRLQMDTNLVGASRVQAQAQKRHPTKGALEREVGAGLATSSASHGHTCADPRVAPNRSLDRAGSRRRATFDECQVFTLDQAPE